MDMRSQNKMNKIIPPIIFIRTLQLLFTSINIKRQDFRQSFLLILKQKFSASG